VIGIIVVGAVVYLIVLAVNAIGAKRAKPADTSADIFAASDS
jgi:hypothetical protein